VATGCDIAAVASARRTTIDGGTRTWEPASTEEGRNDYRAAGPDPPGRDKAVQHRAKG
jgi:hypothetical protein